MTSVKVADAKSLSVVTFWSEEPSKVSPISSVLPPSAVLVFFTGSVLLVDSMGTSSTKPTWKKNCMCHTKSFAQINQTICKSRSGPCAALAVCNCFNVYFFQKSFL